MGRATRWLRSLLTGRKDGKDPKETGARGRKEKKRWSFGKSGRDAEDDKERAPANPAWVRSFCAESEEERNKRAMAVAAATAAAADAAVAAAQAAVAVVRLTSQRRGAVLGGPQEQAAAVKIQTVFRGYLARKALRALRALVRLQALVRGFLVRRQTMAVVHGMQALVRAQATARTQRSGHLRARRSLERVDEARSEYAASFHSGRLSSSVDYTVVGFEESPKIVEIDPGRPRSRTRRVSSPWCDPADAPPPHCQAPPRISTPDRRSSFRDLDWCLTGDECRFSTAQSTPRFINSTAGLVPAKGAYTCAAAAAAAAFARVPQSPGNCPNYMTKTQSFEAKVRSQSAPKQRPEPAGSKKRPSLTEVAESRSSLSGVRMERSCSQAQEAVGFKNAVIGRLGHVAGLARGVERDHSFQRRW
ncbi:hypothetical protein Taro_053127 [Colocasia esculenta]|uniref:DUF4005 domain-containing protein n=1 Tax=Colocasia esculenta TaxID=4460 RepID=A0A843XLN6_COLES|nr:hypothetical protein [Colocasia esculenta]